MLWQDIILAICAFFFAIALIPQILAGFKNKMGLIVISSSIPTFICLYIISFTTLTLKLYYFAFMNFIVGTMWVMLFIQKLIYK